MWGDSSIILQARGKYPETFNEVSKKLVEDFEILRQARIEVASDPERVWLRTSLEFLQPRWMEMGNSLQQLLEWIELLTQNVPGEVGNSRGKISTFLGEIKEVLERVSKLGIGADIGSYLEEVLDDESIIGRKCSINGYSDELSMVLLSNYYYKENNNVHFTGLATSIAIRDLSRKVGPVFVDGNTYGANLLNDYIVGNGFQYPQYRGERILNMEYRKLNITFPNGETEDFGSCLKSEFRSIIGLNNKLSHIRHLLPREIDIDLDDGGLYQVLQSLDERQNGEMSESDSEKLRAFMEAVKKYDDIERMVDSLSQDELFAMGIILAGLNYRTAVEGGSKVRVKNNHLAQICPHMKDLIASSDTLNMERVFELFDQLEVVLE